MISIVSCGIGNISSIANMIKKAGGDSRVVDSPESLLGSKKIVLPGVGSFDHGMAALNSGGWNPLLNRLVLEEKVPVLGICLGMQLMCRSSEEGNLPGLGWIEANVKRLDSKEGKLKIPHMGWNEVKAVKNNSFFLELDNETRFYFVHSYYVECRDSSDVMSVTTYGDDFVSSFSKENIFGVQFHPEKSHKYGLKFIESFLEI